MSLMLLTGDALEHRYVARALSQALPEIRILAEDGHGPGLSASRRIKRWIKRGPGCVLDKVSREIMRRGIGDVRRRQDDLREVFGDEYDLAEPVPGTVFVPSINDPAVLAAAAESRPRLALVYGTGLVRKKTLAAFDCPILNLHTGLSPYYRGVACHYWPLIDGRPDRVGVTVHDCVPELDAGGILATSLAPPQPGDTIHRVFARQVVVGASLYADLARKSLEESPARSEQDLDQGREYRGVELGFMAEWRARRALRRLLPAHPTG